MGKGKGMLVRGSGKGKGYVSEGKWERERVC